MDNKELVGNIRIKEPKKKKSKKSDLSIGKRIFIWFMFIAMLASFAGPLIYYLFSIISSN
ncbi:MAG: hypothetical protein J5982_04485 [Bacilli bacterium]|nr:hypothetical protein [Bacilli bacterium]